MFTKLQPFTNEAYLYREQMVESINNSIDIENRFPIFPQDVEADISFQVNVWMVDLHKE